MLLSYRDIAKHQALVPWKRERQVEQDLLLCLAMQAIFTDGFLSGQVAMRGGTLLHKVHLAPAARYSEDIDLVVHGDRPEGHIEKALRRVLLPVLGKPVGFGWESVKLAIRNAVQPSRVLRLIYSVPNVSGDGPALDIVVEANVTERVSYLPVERVPYAFEFRGERVEFSVNGYETHEMLGTKMRALFQRRRGRDLFDLYWALEHLHEAVNSERVTECFLFYLQKEGELGRSEVRGLKSEFGKAEHPRDSAEPKGHRRRGQPLGNRVCWGAPRKTAERQLRRRSKLGTLRIKLPKAALQGRDKLEQVIQQ